MGHGDESNHCRHKQDRLGLGSSTERAVREVFNGLKSLLIRVEIGSQLSGELKTPSGKGERRLKVHNDRSRDHYGVPCALAIPEPDIAELQKLQRWFHPG
jgi:hypothetical protein